MKFCGKMLVLLLGITTGQLLGDELVYTPVNPSFGGSPLNGSWMLAQAQGQSTFAEAKDPLSSRSRDALEDFTESLNRQILSRLSREVISDLFGEGTLEEGHYEFGNLIVDVVPGAEGLNITIFDSDTGNETNILVPYF